jgi:hypothetical protein
VAAVNPRDVRDHLPANPDPGTVRGGAGAGITSGVVDEAASRRMRGGEGTTSSPVALGAAGSATAATAALTPVLEDPLTA